MSAKGKPDGKRAVLITDTHRGIYFGYLVEELEGGNAVRLENARHCWSYVCLPDHPGVYGLASGGPGPGSRIGPRWNGKVRDVSKVVDVSASAVAKWEAAEWKR